MFMSSKYRTNKTIKIIIYSSIVYNQFVQNVKTFFYNIGKNSMLILDKNESNKNE